MLCRVLHSPVTSSFLGANIFLRTLFSKTFCLLLSLDVRYQISNPRHSSYRTKQRRYAFSGPCFAPETTGTRGIILRHLATVFALSSCSVVTSSSQWRAVSLTASAPSHRGDKAQIRLLPSHSAGLTSQRFGNRAPRHPHDLL